jgi:hypothetical protein
LRDDVDGIFGNGTRRVRDGVIRVDGLVGVNGGRLTLHKNVIRNLLIRISGTIYIGIMHMSVVLTKRR